jgi:predicted nucleic-acid-binding protein
LIGRDTGVLLRYLTADDAEQFDLVKQFTQQNYIQSTPGFIN